MEAESGGTTTPPVGESWIDSNTVVAITGCRMRITRSPRGAAPAPRRTADRTIPAQFTIRGRVNELARFDLLPQITLDPGIAGRSFVAGEPETIRWSANFASTTPYPVEYKHSTSATWSLIASATPQTGFVVWNPPDSPQANLSLRIRDPNDGEPGRHAGRVPHLRSVLRGGPGDRHAERRGEREHRRGRRPQRRRASRTSCFGLGQPAGSRPASARRGAPRGVGNGSFSAGTLTSVVGNPLGFELGDLDRDGDLDLLFGVSGGFVPLALD